MGVAEAHPLNSLNGGRDGDPTGLFATASRPFRSEAVPQGWIEPRQRLAISRESHKQGGGEPLELAVVTPHNAGNQVRYGRAQ
jgi:hypothetical protein